MKHVNFYNQENFKKSAEKAFISQKKIIKKLIPQADVQHVGSTAISNSLTKGDLDIQVRVTAKEFMPAVKVFSVLYELNEGSIKTEEFRSFKDDELIPQLGIQLTVINSEFDFFWKLRDVLSQNKQYRMEYDVLKKKFEGATMESYWLAKDEFFNKIMETPEFKQLKTNLNN